MRRRDPAAPDVPPDGFVLERWAEGPAPDVHAAPDEHLAYRVHAFMRYLAAKPRRAV